MTIYSKTHFPSGFYVYMYLRLDGTPYYIGKGISARAWNHHKTDCIHPPSNHQLITIVAHCLTESEAFLLEIRLIESFGRKDLGTGILRNRTNGGQGSSGRVPSEAQRNKMRGDNNPSKRLEVRNKIKNNHHTKKEGYVHPFKGENHPSYGRKDSDITIARKRAAGKGRSRPELRKVCISPLGEIFNSTKEAADFYKVVPSAIRGLIYRGVSGWKYSK